MGGNELEWIKTVWEALKADVKTRLGIAIGCTFFLVCRSYIEQLPNGKNIFSALAVLDFLVCIFFWVSIILDLVFKIIQETKYKQQDRKYSKYILSLKGRKLDIVKQMYANPQHQHYWGQKDTDIMDLTMHHVIVCAGKYTILDTHVWAEGLSDPPFLYVLQPRALKVIEKHKKKFTDKSA